MSSISIFVGGIFAGAKVYVEFSPQGEEMWTEYEPMEFRKPGMHHELMQSGLMGRVRVEGGSEQTNIKVVVT